MRFHGFALSVSIAAGLSFGAGSIARAADMPLKAPRAPVYQYNWSGFYIGANGGFGTGRSSWTDDPTLTGSDLGNHTTTGGFAGGQIGFNWQWGMMMAGAEFDIDWASLKGNHTDLFLHDLNSKVSSLGTISGRLGVAYWDRLLVYVKGGGAFAQYRYDDFITVGGPLNGSASATRWGWVMGGGLEYAFTRNWSAKIEYNYIDFNTRRLNFGGGASVGYVQDIASNLQLVKAGINYRFGP